MREVGSVWFVCSTTLPEPGKGGTGNLGNVTMRLVPVFYALVPDPYHAWGRGRMGDGERVEEDRGLLGIQVIPRAGSVGSAGADRNGHIPGKK